MDFKQYCELVEKFIENLDVKLCKSLFFQIIDMNKDKQICETDLFNCFKIIDDNDIHILFYNDL